MFGALIHLSHAALSKIRKISDSSAVVCCVDGSYIPYTFRVVRDGKAGERRKEKEVVERKKKKERGRRKKTEERKKKNKIVIFAFDFLDCEQI